MFAMFVSFSCFDLHKDVDNDSHIEIMPIILRFLETPVGICKGPKYMATNRVGTIK